jgi:integrase
MLSAVKSFTAFYETPISLNGLKIRVARVRRKPELSWQNAERIIAKAKDPYQSAYRFLLWSGLGLDEFKEIQNSVEIQTAIEKQRADPTRPYIRIDLRPRKNNIDTYYVLVLKEFVPKLPLQTYEFRVKAGPRIGELLRGGQLIDNLDLEMNWQRACERAGLRQIGVGPHTLRSAFRSQCAKLGVSDAVAEFLMGHGSRDTYGYSREYQDEALIARELAKLWQVVTPQDASLRLAADDVGRVLAAQGKTIEELSERLRQLAATITTNRAS